MIEHEIKVVMMDEAVAFVRSLPQKVQEKITYNFLKIQQGLISKELFKKLEGTEIWEFRTLFNGNCYRLFSFWDTDTETLIIATHGIIKKTQKTPKKEISKAEIIKQEYFKQKER
ncbi:type II toxin-antitoxin system RelE/ParE family toxin [Prevotella veroralis]|uniref:Toxin-antitoxin system, toxin component, RelE family n=1 Tax=Prevotella veroralis F0319 TaxID=649761 RepID=C9MR26_9BACT|nr:type II toxin-antitoxin system RelE/ParE family toxin [Prevotella veroralis]EEX17999.1 toxin-antitoxin system, toxin component, RelE family [Prevotella veroralis F0319]QUB40344.1 type II toxin-antitoxin system RelE/ParE family toxin [Prevotella veroralis]